MQTIFFVPKDENPDDYVDDCSLWGLPIVHGVSNKLTEHNLNFEKAGVLKIPEKNNFFYNEEFPVGFHQKATLENDFYDLRNDFTLNVFNKRSGELEYENLKPFFAEKHRVRWVFQIVKTGKYDLIVLKNGEPFNDDKNIFYVFLREKLWN